MKPAHQFDYVIVGGGTAGCVLAARLSESPDCRVLLLEAGGHVRRLRVAMPLAFPTLGQIRELNWHYLGEEEAHANHRRLNVRMGRGVGGSTLVNGMIYSRGHPADYDDWASHGAPGWGFADVLPAFIRAETHWRTANAIHGDAGPIAVNRNSMPLGTCGPIAEAGRRMGLSIVDDLSMSPYEGMCPPEFTVDARGRRSSAASYLRLAARRSNLKVLTQARVLRLVIQNGRAQSVETLVHGRSEMFGAAREIIVAAGAYQSPQLLMLSGVGPSDALTACGIRVLVDSPGVGRNLQNHVTITTLHRVGSPVTFHSRLRADRVACAGLQWLTRGGGSLAQVPLSLTALMRTRPDLDRPDVQVSYTEGAFDDRPWLAPFRLGPGHRLTIFNMLLRPRSRGAVGLANADPATPPRIRFDLLADPDDMATLCRSVKLQRELLSDMAGQGLRTSEVRPGSAVSGGDLKAFIRAHAVVSQHPVGTCAMGSGSEAVVDHLLRVRGVERLRVIDASIAPRIVGANTCAMTLMIAERGASLVAHPDAVCGVPDVGSDRRIQ